MGSEGNQQVLDFADGGVIASGARVNLLNLIIEKSDGPTANLSDPGGIFLGNKDTDNGLLKTQNIISESSSTVCS